MMQTSFEALVQEALAQDFEGWDFSWTRGRWHEGQPSWNYGQLVKNYIQKKTSLLDMGTGGGEFLASIGNLPRLSYATESYPPNIPIARQRLEPLGVRVVAHNNDEALLLPDGTFDLVINRHESYYPPELQRILKQDGTFLTQQVGTLDCIQLNEFLDAPKDPDMDTWALEWEIKQIEQAGLSITRAEEELLDSIFDDIGVVVFYLKVIEWQIPDFSIDKYHDRLLEMHRYIQSHGPFRAKAHRFLIEAEKR